MIKPGTILQDRYFVGKQIGSGGMGAVYMAIDNRFESQVAIKETFFNDETLSEAFEREARLLNNLHHPVLPHVSDFFTEDGAYFLVMEFIEGEDLSEKLKIGKPLPAADVLRWANQLLDALDYLHSQNPPIIHRDIKPHNLKITTRGDIILLDFGLAKLETADSQSEHSVFGYSRTYSPLEQIEGTGTDARSDIFSLGATGYHLLTGRPPIDALKRAAAILAGQSDPLQPVSDFHSEISSALDHILQTALALNPNDRYESAHAMQTAIEYALDESYEPAAEITTNEQPAKVDIVVIPINEVTEEPSFSALAAFAADAADAAHNSENKTQMRPTIETAAKDNREDRYSAPFSVTVLDNRTASAFKKLVPIALILLFILAGGFIVWSYVGRKNSPNEQAQLPIVQEPQPLSASVLPVENTVEPEPESKLAEQYIISPTQEEKEEDLVRPNSLVSAPSKKTNTKSPKKEVKETEVPAPSVAIPKAANPPKDSKPKTAPKQNVASTNLIIVPNSGLTRPRVISKRSTSKSRESSASEINRFMIGKP